MKAYRKLFLWECGHNTIGLWAEMSGGALVAVLATRGASGAHQGVLMCEVSGLEALNPVTFTHDNLVDGEWWGN